MTQREQITYHPAWVGRLVEQRPVSRGEAQLLSRLADAAIETAREFGVPCTRREAIQRSRENLAYVHQAVLAKGIAESELVL